MVVYFSGTGNSKYVAKRIADELQDSIISINELLKNDIKDKIEANGKLIICAPTYLSRMPHIVEDWFKEQEFINAHSVYFVLTYYNTIGAGKDYNQKLCEEKGFKYMGTKNIHMPNNHIEAFITSSVEEAKIIIEESEKDIDELINTVKSDNKIQEKKSNFIDKTMSSLVNAMFYKFLITSKGFVVTDKCIGCGKCVSRCPLNNISIKDGRPVWGDNCTHCSACICYCPQEAIEFGKKSIGQTRYNIEKIKNI